MVKSDSIYRLEGKIKRYKEKEIQMHQFKSQLRESEIK